MFTLFRQKAFGLDLSDLSLKIVKLGKKRRDLELTSFGRQEIPSGFINNGVIQKEQDLIKIIQETMDNVEGEPLKTKYCIASLPETEAFIRVIEMPKMTKEELNQAIKWEVEANIPLPIDEVYFDWQILPTDKNKANKLDILIGALSRKLIDSYLDVFKKADLVPLVFEIESIATARALIKKGSVSQPVMIIDLGARRTSFIIFSGQTVAFTASLPISNRSLVDDVAKNLGIDWQKARELKFKIGLDQTKEEGKVYNALAPSVQELCRQARKYIDFFQSHIPKKQRDGQPISNILLCGGGANLTGLARFISLELKIPTEPANPWINIFRGPMKETPEMPYQESLAYTTALGLALRGLGKDYDYHS